jgi:hypothetical protein
MDWLRINPELLAEICPSTHSETCDLWAGFLPYINEVSE